MTILCLTFVLIGWIALLICSVNSSGKFTFDFILAFFLDLKKKLLEEIVWNNLRLLTLNPRCEVEESNTKCLEQQVDVLRRSRKAVDQRSTSLQEDIRHSMMELQELHQDFQVTRIASFNLVKVFLPEIVCLTWLDPEWDFTFIFIQFDVVLQLEEIQVVYL